MYRLITQIESKYMRGPCGPPYKRFLEFQQKTSPQDTYSPKKGFIIQNFGQSHLYRNIKIQKVSIEEDSLPLIRSNIVLVMGLSNQSLNLVMQPLQEQSNDIIEIEIIKDRNKRNLLVVVFLLNQQAEDFYVRYNFSMMPDQSHLVTIFLQDIIFVKASESKHPDQLHLLLTGNLSSTQTDDIWIQLPLCLSCLQKIESRLSGIHYISYGQQIQARKPSLNCNLCMLSPQSTKCSKCSQTKQIWGCLICSSLGCGRYKQGHAELHCFQNNHIFAMQIKTNRIWNYQQDTFVHRILAGEIDVVNLSQNNLGENQGESTDGISWDFCNQITQQLEKQRGYYQIRMVEQESKFMIEKEALEKKLTELKQTYAVRSKEANAVKIKKDKQEKKRKEMIKKIEEQKQLNKLIQHNIRVSTAPTNVENQTIKRKKQQLGELETRLSELLTELDFN